jgi:spore germination protein KA
MTVGRVTQTCVMVCYLDGVVNRGALEELMRRLSAIDIDGILDSNYLTELIREHRHSLFRTIGYTERPDVVVGKLLEGRIAVLVDGTPVALTVPYLFIEHFQSSEDYYLSFYYTSFSRLLRMLGFFMTISVPGLYIAIVAFHHEMLPSPLLLNITAERASVPLPAALEAFHHAGSPSTSSGRPASACPPTSARRCPSWARWSSARPRWKPSWWPPR